MKRFMILSSALLVLGGAAFAHEGHEHAKNATKAVTLTGEVVDITCYMQHPASATGPDHAKCAKSCISKGLPIGFLAENGTLYNLIGKEHEPVAATVADHLGAKSKVTGVVVESHGMKAIELESIGAAVSGAKAAAQPGAMPGKQPVAKTKGTASPVTYYTCAMDPEVHQDHPGNCPKCGMELIPEKKK